MNGFTDNLIIYSKQVAEGIKAVKKTNLSTFRKVFSLMAKSEKIAFLLLFLAAIFSLFLSLKNIYVNNTKIVPAIGGNLIEGVKGQPLYLNPILAFQEPDTGLIKLVFSGLYKFDNNGNLIPDLAEGMPILSEDQKQYTINLKRNAKWHNGRQVTADDIVFTINLVKNPEFKSPQRGLWLSTNIEKISDFQIKLSTKDVSGPFIYNLTLPILPKSLWGKVEPQNFPLSELNLKAVGSGPYSIKNIETLKNGKIKSITLESFSNYHLGKPKIFELTIKFYESDDALFNAFQSKEIKNFGFFASTGQNKSPSQDSSKIFKLTTPQYETIFFNLNNKLLSDQNFRNALALSINRQEIISSILEGNASLPKITLGNTGGSEIPLYQTSPNLETAKQLLEKNGWIIDPITKIRTKKEAKAEFTISTNDNLTNIKVAEFLIKSWEQLNIKVSLKTFSTKQLNDEVVKGRNFDALLFPQKLGADPDPFIMWHSSQINDPGKNFTGFENPASDKIITESRTNTDLNVRLQKYQQFYQLLTEKQPAIFLYQTQYIYIADNNIQNIGLNILFDASNRFYDLPNWHIDTARSWK